MQFKACFYIKSPLQYLNAIEAKYHYGYAADDCLLVLHADKKNYDQLKNIIKRNEWSSIVSLNAAGLKPDFESKLPLNARHPVFYNNVFTIIKLSSIANQVSSVEKVFIGDARNPLMQHFANKLDCDDLILLDDGLGSRVYAQWRREGWSGSEYRLNKRINRLIKKVCFGLCDGLPCNLTFFSAYDMDVPSHDCYVKNDFAVLRKSFEQLTSCDTVYFLGGALVEVGILTEEEYFSQLQLVNQYYNGVTVTYVAHRREDPGRVLRIGNKLGWDTTQFDYPIEFQLAVIGPRPQQLSSFISSALENCKAIFGSALPIRAFRFDPDFFSGKETERGAGVWGLFDYYESISTESFKLISLKTSQYN